MPSSPRQHLWYASHLSQSICDTPHETRDPRDKVAAEAQKAEFRLRHGVPQKEPPNTISNCCAATMMFQVLGGHHAVYFAIIILWDSTKKVGGRTKTTVLIDGRLPDLQSSYKR